MNAFLYLPHRRRCDLTAGVLLILVLALGNWLSVTSAVAAEQVPFRITEFMAANTGALLDDDGDASDWIEIQNLSGSPASLDGWYLTDDRAVLSKWRLPGPTVAAGASVLVFASGKNRVTAGAPLHASFRLDSAGGYLALVRDDGLTVASEFRYGGQFPGISFGVGLGPSRTPEPLVLPGASLKYLIPTGPVPDAWRGPGFDDSAWTGGTMAAGYDLNFGPLTTAYSVPANTAGNQAYGGALGLDFDVTQPVSVTELGCFDDTGNGIGAGATITVALWRRNNGGTPTVATDDTGAGIMAVTNFTTGAPGTLVGGQRFKTLAVPVTLTNGSYTIVAFGYGAAERLANNLGVVSPNSGGGALTFVGRSRYGDNTAAFPATADAAVAQYAAGTFRFQALPAGGLSTDLLAMRGINASALFRLPFTLTADAAYSTLALNVAYDDGFVAFLNGAEIGRRNAPSSLAFNSAAVGPAFGRVALDVSTFANLLVPGSNVLAIHGLNASVDDDDFRLEAGLDGERASTNTVYFTAPTPGAANGTGLLYPQVVINEIHVDTIDSKLRPIEFIELYNPRAETVDLSGWSFARGVDYVFPAGASIPGHGYLVVAENPAVLLSRLGANALGPWVGRLDNGGETIELVDANAVVIDRVSYGLGFPWPTVGDNEDSMQLIHEGLDNDLGGSWRSALPTPGARNRVTTGNAPPQIRQVDHFPGRPVAGDDVVITARVTDPDGVAQVTLEYQIVAPGTYLRLADPAFTNSWSSMALRDDGTEGDAVAGDEIYSGRIPASVQVNRTLVRYRLAAVDRSGAGVRVPYADDPSPNFAYFVYNGVPAWTGAVQPGVTPAETFGTNLMRQLQAFHLISRSNDVWNCQYNAAFNDGTYRFEGALVVDGRVYDHVHYRAKGQNSTYNTGKNKWKFRFNRGHWLELPDDYGRSTTTIETLNVSSLPSSWAPWNRGMAGLDERMQYRLTELAGVPAPRGTYFQLRVIDDPVEQPATQFDGDFWGLYFAFENQDNRFKEAHGLPDGNIFRLQVTGAGNHLLGQGEGQPADLSDLNAFVSTTTGYNFTPAQPEAWWRTNVDLMKYFSWRAVNEAVNNTDIRDQENVVYFRDPQTGLWHIEPWDSDLLYEQFDRWGPEATQSTAAYERIRRCLTVTNINLEFQARVRELQDLLLNSDQAWKLVDEYVSLITEAGPNAPGFVEADRRRWDYNPINPLPPRGVAATGNYYKTPYPVPNMGLGPPQPFFRVLTSPDFAGLVTWVKNFIAFDAHGGARLASLAQDATIPNTPALEYVGDPEFGADGLTFQASVFGSPTNRTFAAMQWRLGEVYDPSVPNFVQGEPWRYEITEVWQSGELGVFNAAMTLPPTVVREGRTYRARVKYKDSAGRWSHWSDPVQFTAGSGGAARLAQSLIVSELMYNPLADGPVNGDEFEFIELKNVGTAAINLGGVSFTAGINFTFPPGTALASGAAFLLVRNTAEFGKRYPGRAADGVYSGRFDNGGETITLSHPVGGTILSFAYDDELPWPNAADGFGFSLVPVDATAPFDHRDPLRWRASAVSDGSPGLPDPSSSIPPVRINEVLANSDLPAVDWIELANPTANPVDIGGWFLSDDPALPRKFRIPTGTIIGPAGFLVLSEVDFNVPGRPGAFSLRGSGDEVLLHSGDTQTNLTGYSHGFAFGASASGVTFGRYVNSVGEEQFPAQSTPTPGAANSGPRVGPIVISEIQYHPLPGDDEFVELKNISSDTVHLYEPLHPTNTWRLSGVGFVTPTNLTLEAGRTLLLVGIDPAVFRARHGVPAPVQILGPFSGQLQDSGERLEWQRPDVPGTNGVPFITIDSVRYNDRAPWPIAADGSGASLQRRMVSSYGDDPANWDAANSTPGEDFLPGAGSVPTLLSQPQSRNVLLGQSVNFSVSASGGAPLQFQWAFNGDAISGATSSNLALSQVRLAQAGNYSVVVFNRAGSAASSVAHLTVSTPLLILSQPTNVVVRPGAAASFRVVGAGTGTLRYQWLRNGEPLPGATSSVLSVPSAQLADAGDYQCVVTDAVGATSSSVARLTLLIDPVIVLQPVSQTALAGSNVVISISVTNTATLPIGYRLRRNGGLVTTNVAGSFQVLTQHTAFFLLSGTNAAPPWTNYAIVVTNFARPGGILSTSAFLTYVLDSDGDGLSDDWEAQYFGAGGAAPGADADGDGVTNRDEYQAGTDPVDPAGYLRIDSLAVGGEARLTFGAISNRTYTVQFTDVLGGGVWTDLIDVPARATNHTVTAIDRNPGLRRVYRVALPARR